MYPPILRLQLVNHPQILNFSLSLMLFLRISLSFSAPPALPGNIKLLITDIATFHSNVLKRHFDASDLNPALIRQA